MTHNNFNKIILITGVAGFIGSNVICYFVKKYPNYLFIGLDKITYCSSLKNIQEISYKPNFIFVKADITNIEIIENLFNKYKISDVIHYAAYSHVDYSFDESILFTKNNILGTHILLEVFRKSLITRNNQQEKGKFIYISTDEVYGDSLNERSDESSVLNPTNPYSATKAAAEQIVHAYYKSFKVPIIITRSNNVYGPKQYPEKVIPKFILNLLSDNKCEIHGTGSQRRSFLYIDDICEAFDIIFHKGNIGEIYNIGCDYECSIKELLNKLTIITNKDDKGICVQDRLYNDKRYYISFDKIKKLGWTPSTNLDEGLKKTLDWYKNNVNYFE